MYALRLKTVYLVIAISIFLWIIMGVVFSKVNRERRESHCWKLINLVGVLISLYGILSYTVLNRTPSDTHIYVFMNEYGPEFYREMIMNAFLYFPFGLTLSTLIGPVSIPIAFILSVTIESWQYITGSGVAQGTDVIMNTLGCAIGAVPWFLIRFGLVEKTVSLLKKIIVSIRNHKKGGA